MSIKFLYETTDLTQKQIAAQLGINWKHVFKTCKQEYSSAYRKERHRRLLAKSKLGELNPMYGMHGAEHPRYVGDVGDCKGYLMRLKPDWYTGRKGSKHVFVHSIVMCEHLGLTEIPAKWCVHHCDSNPHNNSIDNLIMLPMYGHMQFHGAFGSATTISKESTAKWLETHGIPHKV